MGNSENQFEGEAEHIPTEEEVMEIIGRKVDFPGKVVPLRDPSFDEKGLYFLNLRAEGENPGETAEYVYYRKGVMPNGVEISETSIEVSYYQNGELVSGARVAVFNYETGRWEEMV